jgi:hypothetical protein
MTDTDMSMLLQKERVKKRIGRMRVKKKDKAVSVSVIAWCYNVLTLLDYMGQRAFEYSDITATSTTHTVMQRSLNSLQKQATIIHHI